MGQYIVKCFSVAGCFELVQDDLVDETFRGTKGKCFAQHNVAFVAGRCQFANAFQKEGIGNTRLTNVRSPMQCFEGLECHDKCLLLKRGIPKGIATCIQNIIVGNRIRCNGRVIVLHRFHLHLSQEYICLFGLANVTASCITVNDRIVDPCVGCDCLGVVVSSKGMSAFHVVQQVVSPFGGSIGPTPSQGINDGTISSCIGL
mmetsp:Transcript_10428/g.19025  ORF Transcript_10428/g.19025 Transcript_10428/m.19025 type:complete len:202 (+) Transcript_10428:303-908(+)